MLRTPEVARWWGDPDEQATLLRADLSEPRMVMEIVSFVESLSPMRRTYDIPYGAAAHFRPPCRPAPPPSTPSSANPDDRCAAMRRFLKALACD